MDKLIEGFEKSFGPMVRKPDDMPLDDFFKVMRKANTPPFDITRAHHWEERYPYLNGTVWDRFHSRRVLTYCGGIDGDEWIFLAFSQSIVGGGACIMSPQHWEDGRCVIKGSELPLRLNGWKCIGFWDGVEYPDVVPDSQCEAPEATP